MNGFARGDFYSAAAQVLPVLFLAIAVEFRVLTYTVEEVKEELEAGSAAMFVAANVAGIGALVATMALGEAAALRVLAEQRTLAGADVFVIGALIASGATLVLAPIAMMLGAVRKALPDSNWEIAWELTWIALVLTVFAMPVYGVVRLLDALF